jgi:hypothetical protein
MQYISKDKAYFAKLYPASLSMIRKLYGQIKKILNEEQKLFMEYLNVIEKGSHMLHGYSKLPCRTVC